jgi:hypothetical protein
VILTGRNAERLQHAASEVDALSTAAFDAADPVALDRFFRDLPTIDHVMVTAGRPYYGRLADMDFAKIAVDARTHNLAIVAPGQKVIEGLQVLQPPILPRPHFIQIPSQFHEPGVPLGFGPPLPGQDLVDLGQNEQSPPGLSLSNIGGMLVRKLVKQTKVLCSWTRHQRRFGQVQPSQTATTVGTAGAEVLLDVLNQPAASDKHHLRTSAIPVTQE